MMNQIILEGIVMSPVSTKQLTNGFHRKSFVLQNIHEFTWNDQTKKDVSYFNCDVYNDNIEIPEQGKKIRIVGRLKQSRWEVEQEKREKVYVLVQHLELLP